MKGFCFVAYLFVASALCAEVPVLPRRPLVGQQPLQPLWSCIHRPHWVSVCWGAGSQMRGRLVSYLARFVSTAIGTCRGGYVSWETLGTMYGTVGGHMPGMCAEHGCTEAPAALSRANKLGMCSTFPVFISMYKIWHHPEHLMQADFVAVALLVVRPWRLCVLERSHIGRRAPEWTLWELQVGGIADCCAGTKIRRQISGRVNAFS